MKDKIVQDKEFKLWNSNRQKLVRDHNIEAEITTTVGKSKLLRKDKLSQLLRSFNDIFQEGIMTVDFQKTKYQVSSSIRRRQNTVLRNTI